MSKAKILYVCSKMKPYLGDDNESTLCRELPQALQEMGGEVRSFMPKFGDINERRSQLHEVIRLSGMNILIDQTEHQLIIKVASIPVARMQVYFIDNDDFFHRKGTISSSDGVMFQDNDERSMFYARGVIETVSKLRWSPEIIHCSDWFSAMVPAYIKKRYRDIPLFENSKIVLSLHDGFFEGELDKEFARKMICEEITEEDVKVLTSPTYENIIKFALQYTDGVIITGSNVPTSLIEYVRNSGVELLEIDDNINDFKKYSEFYDKILAK